MEDVLSYQYHYGDFPVNVIKQVAARSDMDSKMAELTISLTNPSLLTCDIEDAFPLMKILYTPTPPQIFEIGKCSIKMYLKHHEEQIEDILNYLEELSFHRIEKMEEGRINGNELKTELKEIRTQIIKLQKKRLGQKDKIAFAHYRISDLEQIIEKIQAYHQTNQEDL
ncbi:hypothetical protein Tco_1133050 [Tanacetum coccineum]|uniref:Uncharacterized protein n=1 Tax=Tanacetum coccineum TaxID=301880 RepID=A0ABQ5JEB6_9ASTR